MLLVIEPGAATHLGRIFRRRLEWPRRSPAPFPVGWPTAASTVPISVPDVKRVRCLLSSCVITGFRNGVGQSRPLNATEGMEAMIGCRMLHGLVVALLLCGLLPAPAPAQFKQQGPKLVGTGAVGRASEGWSVALSGDGNTAIVGGPDARGGGAAFVFTRSQGCGPSRARSWSAAAPPPTHCKARQSRCPATGTPRSSAGRRRSFDTGFSIDV